MPDLQAILAAWPVPGPRTLRPTHVGANNLSHVVQTPAASYVLRIYQNTNDLTRIRYEHNLLLRLQRTGLSFAVPQPILTTSRLTYVSTADQGRDIVAALFSMARRGCSWRMLPHDFPPWGLVSNYFYT